MELTLSFWDCILAIGITTIGSALQGSVGFGLGPLAVPLLVLIDPIFVPGPLLLAAVLLTVMTFVRERSEVDFSGFKWAVSGRLIGTVLGATLLALMPVQYLALIFAILVIIAVLIFASGVRIRAFSWSVLGAGTLSGFMGTVAAIGGAPMALIYQDEKGPRLRSTLASIFMVGTVLGITSLIIIGKFGLHEILLAALITPGILLGFWISTHTKKYLDRGYIRTAVLTMSGLSALVLIIKYFSS
jgi:uncharacterized membrane protein YfcA